ncbi:hypothetical protein [Yinghuangia seranimata]|uniref:hypothetical protein n=1 Tax=Yinghuangia seranimata TaxID=408067 RepID=UPI00248D04F2|nr:hypothetical protein [Yinghuangia seranimata]MDI2125985.1 hypothetical protein [Yinghuangia seranimata]
MQQLESTFDLRRRYTVLHWLMCAAGIGMPLLGLAPNFPWTYIPFALAVLTVPMLAVGLMPRYAPLVLRLDAEGVFLAPIPVFRKAVRIPWADVEGIAAYPRHGQGHHLGVATTEAYRERTGRGSRRLDRMSDRSLGIGLPVSTTSVPTQWEPREMQAMARALDVLAPHVYLVDAHLVPWRVLRGQPPEDPRRR